MTAIASLDSLINNLTGGGAVAPDHEWSFMAARVAGAASPTPTAARFASLWKYEKTNGATGATPPGAASAAAPTLATVGAMPFTNPTGGRQKFLLGMENGMAVAGSLIIYDRLMHCAGIVASTAGATSLTGGAVTRYTGAAADGNQIWLEYDGTANAIAGHTVTVTYTNQAGVGSRTSKTVQPGAQAIGTMVPVPLQDGDSGVQSVQSVTVGATVATAGCTFGVVIARPLLSCTSAGVAGGAVRDAISGLPAMPEIKTDACLAFMFFSQAASVISGFAGVHLAEN